MYSDSFINFSKLIEEQGQDEALQIFTKFSGYEPSFLIDTGIKADDIWARVQSYRQFLDLFDEETDAKIKQRLSNIIYFTAGIMPDYDSVENRFDEVEKLEATINDFKNSDDEYASRLIAIGSSGIDHDWESADFEGREHDYFDLQTIKDERDLFALQLTLAKKLDMPFILHSRKGFNDTSDVLKAVKWNRGVVHGFAYTQSELEFFLNLGWYISFSGTVTYGGKKNFSDMSEVVAYVPKDRILIETDSPYYAPLPLKNNQNNPVNINYIYEYIASKRNISSRKLSEIVDANFHKLFGV